MDRRKKIDWHILPLFMVTQGLAYLDKTATNYANIFGIRASLHITQAQFVSPSIAVCLTPAKDE